MDYITLWKNFHPEYKNKSKNILHNKITDSILYSLPPVRMCEEMEKQFIIPMFIRFLKKHGVYCEYLMFNQLSQKDGWAIFPSMAIADYICNAFPWSVYPQIDWEAMHASWRTYLFTIFELYQ